MTSISNLYLGVGLIYSIEWGKFPWSVGLTVNRYCTDKNSLLITQTLR